MPRRVSRGRKERGSKPGGLADALRGAELAIASTAPSRMECAWFGVPAVTLYKTSWATYQIGRRIVKVNSLTMPNLLAGTTVYPEFLQDAATGGEHCAGRAGIVAGCAAADRHRVRTRENPGDAGRAGS
jgi:hypothetical protein